MALDHTGWDFYQCTIGESPASIRVNLTLHERAPVEQLPHTMRLRVNLRFTGPRGMIASEEAPVLDDLEDRLRQQVPDTRLVARVTNAGRCDYHLYTAGPEEAFAVVERLVREVIPEHRYECGTFEDAEWKQYLDFLYPNELAWQWILDRRTLESLEAEGDDLQRARPIKHWAYFPTAEACSRFEREIEGLDYCVDERLAPEPDDKTFGVAFSTASDERPIDIFPRTERLAILASQLGGDYDGWEAQVQTG